MKKIFLRGLAFLLPITLTMYLLYWLVIKAEFITSFVAKQLGLSFNFPGIGIIFTVLFIAGIGALSLSNFFNRLMSLILETLGKVPIVKTIFTPLRELMKFFGEDEEYSNKKVVLVKFQNIRCLGLVTNSAKFLSSSEEFSSLVSVYIPMSYAFGGYTILVDQSELLEIDMPVDQAMKLAVTGWINKN